MEELGSGEEAVSCCLGPLARERSSLNDDL